MTSEGIRFSFDTATGETIGPDGTRSRGGISFHASVAKQARYFPAGRKITPVSADELWNRLDELEHLFRCFATSGEVSDRIRADLADKARESVAVLERGDRYPTDPNGVMPGREG